MSVERECNIENQHRASKKMKVTTMKEEEKVIGTDDDDDDCQVEYHVILFYKYGPLSDDHEIMQVYKDSIITLGNQLNLTGRVLIGVSRNTEGINGTLAGAVKEDVLAFTYANMGQEWCEKYIDEMKNKVLACQRRKNAIEKFWKSSKDFMKLAKVPFLTMDSLQDFKWSTTFCSKEKNNNVISGPFPDLNIKLVKEIINTGGKFSSIDIEDTNKGHLAPEEWHKEMLQIQNKQENDQARKNETILIDCRNHKEYEIGHFSSALDPNTKTFEQFPRWVQENKTALDGKKILMYCTGGIRCEKASAFIRKETDALSVQHLKGGIHKYLDKYGSDGTFKGKNFVFDRRIAATATKKDDNYEPNTGQTGKNGTNDHGIIVGKCLYCLNEYDTFTADGVCTVCREPTLVCPSCRDKLSGEFHCSDHQQLKDCYFTDLSRFGIDDLKKQVNELQIHLQKIAVGKRFKQRRKTLHKQLSKVLCHVEKLQKCHIGQTNNDLSENYNNCCRNCGDSTCNGQCWGFHGLSRKEKLKREIYIQDKSLIGRLNRPSANQRSSKLKQKEEDINEILRLKLSLPPSEHRDEDTSIRCPPPCVRLLKSTVKGKWCGRTVASVIESDFSLSIGKDVNEIINMGLIRVNGIPIDNERALRQSDKNEVMSSDEILKNMDVLSRLVHWHEPPVIVPNHILVTKTELGKEIKDEFLVSSNDNSDTQIYCCNKPSTVPVHPAGPYLSNTLTLMVEAQESLDPRTLLPLHRLDRCVSGLVLCCTSPYVARLFQSYMNSDKISKLYLARVKGKFPGSQDEATDNCPSNSSPATDHARWSWRNNDSSIEVNAPIEVIDASNGIRAVRPHGKQSTSRFCLISYDSTNNRSLIACRPITGRGHQLRVHLQWLGFPINNDVQYGGSKNSDSITRETVFKAIKNAAEKETNGTLFTNEIDVQLAKNTCQICRDASNMKDCFNSAQLLDEGYSIDLHALKYKIYLEKKEKPVTSSNSKSNVTEIEFSVDYPSWIDLFDETSSNLAEITKDFI